MTAHSYMRGHGAEQRDLSLAQLLFSLAIIGGLVYVIAGLPLLPTSLPSIPANLDIQLELLVRSPTSEQLGAAVQLLEWAFWLGWVFVAATTLLRIIVVLATRVADGAAWVRSLRWLSDLLTLPFIRRAVDGSMAGALLLRVALVAPSAPVAQAAPIAAQLSPVDGPTASPAAAASTRVTTPDHLPADMQPGDVLHVVQYGETLISISQTHFGDEDHWKQIHADNRHRPQPHRGSLNDAGKIYPGWVLVIRRPSRMVEYDADGTAWHTVRKGESLWGICAAVYGDGESWPDLFAANEGLEYRGYVLRNPNVIQPGMRFQLVGLEVQPAAPAAPDEPEQAPAPQQQPDSVAIAPDPTPPVVEPSSTPDIEQAPSVSAPTVSMPTAEPVATDTEVSIEEQSSPPPASSAIPAPPADTIAAPWDNVPAWAPEAAGAAAGIALIGLGLAGARRTRRRRSPWDETDVQVVGGFAQATGDETEYEAPAAALADQVLNFARGKDCSSIQLHGVYAGRTGAGLVLSVTPDHAEALAAAAAAFGSNPKSVQLKPTDDGDYQWEQSWASVRLRPVTESQSDHVQLLPIGLAGDRRVLYANSSATGTMLVAGLASAGVHDLLTALIVDRARRQRPDELRLFTIARRDRLDPVLAELPHQLLSSVDLSFVDPDDELTVAGTLNLLRRHLEHRLQHGQGDSPDLLFIVDELTDLGEPGPVVDLLARHGLTVGMSMLAATTRMDDVSLERWVGLFGTRLVLRTPDEASSTRLLGDTGAEDLDAVGQLWPWVQGRLLHRVRGFRIPSLHLADLVERMRERAEGDRMSASTTGAEDESFFDPDTSADVASDPSEAVRTDLGDVAEQGYPPAASVGAVAPRPDRSSTEPVTSYAATTTDSSKNAAHQLPLIGAVALSPAVFDGEATESLVELRLFGHQTSLVRGVDATPQDSAALRKFRRGWSLLLAIAALPDTKASLTRIGELLWQAAGDDLDLLTNRIQSNLSNARQVLQATGLTAAEARQLVRTEGGLCLLDRDQVRSDVWEFLDAQRTGNRALATGRTAEAIYAYRHARALYVGPLLANQQATHPWVNERVGDGLTLREAYHCQWRELTERLADMLEGAGEHTEAAPLYRELLLDPHALPSRGRDLAETREAHALGVCGCSRALGDLAGLEQVVADLKLALHRDDVNSAVNTTTRLTPETVAMFEQARQELRTRTVSNPTGRPGDPPAAAGD